MSDLTTLTAAQRARLLESVVVHASDAVLITEAEPIGMPGPRVVYVNPAFTRMTGHPPDYIIGRTPRVLQGPNTSRTARAQIREALANWQPITIELLNYRRDRSEFWVELSITPVADENGYFTHWISVQRDITARRSADEERTRARIASEKQLALAAEIEERQRAELRLAYNATHDELTSLYNRAHFLTALQTATAGAQADPNATFAVLHLDLNRFKYVNERLGWRIGDQVLRDLARRLEGCIRAGDTLARIGGDAFALLLEGPEAAEQSLRVATRLLSAIAGQRSSEAGNVTIAASVGIVHSTGKHRDAHEVLQDAETALHHARLMPTDTYVLFSPEMRDEAEVSLRTRNDLHDAVLRGEMRLHVQPLVDIALGRVYGFEALVRWQHPQRGLIGPAHFIDIAETTGMIVELGRWVLFEGARMAKRLQQEAGRPLLMSVNVSSRQLLDPQFIGDLRTALSAADLEPGSLQLEITESVFLAGPAVVGVLFAQIRELGVQIALDDFGTGYSSLSYLERFQIDTLKIDQSFVARIDDVSAKSEIVRMIIALAHALGVDVVAEGVETRTQRDALGTLGCTHLQGYLFSRPVPEAEATLLVTDGSAPHARLRPLLSETLVDNERSALDDVQRNELHEQVKAAMLTHYGWMERLRTAVATGESAFDLDEVAREDRCSIGIWLNSTICDKLRRMPLYFVTKSRHAVFHRSAARLLAAVAAGDTDVAQSLRPDGDVTMVASSLQRTLEDWLAVAAAERMVAFEERVAQAAG